MAFEDVSGWPRLRPRLAMVATRAHAVSTSEPCLQARNGRILCEAPTMTPGGVVHGCVCPCTASASGGAASGARGVGAATIRVSLVSRGRSKGRRRQREANLKAKHTVAKQPPRQGQRSVEAKTKDSGAKPGARQSQGQRSASEAKGNGAKHAALLVADLRARTATLCQSLELGQHLGQWHALGSGSVTHGFAHVSQLRHHGGRLKTSTPATPSASTTTRTTAHTTYRTPLRVSPVLGPTIQRTAIRDPQAEHVTRRHSHMAAVASQLRWHVPRRPNSAAH